MPIAWPRLLYDNDGYSANSSQITLNFSSIIPDSTAVPIIPKIIPT